MGIHDFTVYDMLKRNARLYENTTALVCANEQITFSKLLRQVQSLSGNLLRQGVHQKDRLAIMAQNCHNFFLLYGAAAAIGAIAVPINWRLSREEVQSIILDSTPKFIFFDKNYGDLISQLRANCKSLQKFFVFDESEGDFASFTELLDNYRFVEMEVSGGDPYIIIYTAATDGKPKGAILSQNNIIFCNIQAIAMMGLTSNDAYLNILPLYHAGDIVLALSIMHAGGKNVIIPKFDPEAVLQVIEKERVTMIGTFPPILEQLTNEISREKYELSFLRYTIGVESANSMAEFEKKIGSQCWIDYGQTETMAMTTFSPYSKRAGSSGRQGLLVDIKIVDEYDREVGVGKNGEILTRGPLVFQGYWGQDELTKYTFRDGWHHTGDIGRLDTEGYLWFAGRKAEKELIKSGGENVYPVEVEKVILEHPSIEEVTVIGVPDPKYGEGIKAICVLKPDRKLMEQELIDFVASKIARYKKPRYALFVDLLPKKEDGSIDREKVKAIYSRES